LLKILPHQHIGNFAAATTNINNNMTAVQIKIMCSRLITGTCDPSNVGSSTDESSLDAGLG